MSAKASSLRSEAKFEVVRAGSRGHFDHGWLDTYHTFSFGDYHDPRRMGFRSLRVMNEDWVAPGHGFGTHPHRDMEIITYVLEGTLLHGDSMGNGGPIHAGDTQRITAGTGITHSERNASSTDPVHLYQIWILPERKGLTPGYEQKTFDPSSRLGRWQAIASRDGREGSLTIHQDASIYLARLAEGETLEYQLPPGRSGWLQVVRGKVVLGDVALEPGDAVAIQEFGFQIEGRGDAEVMLFDLG